MMYRSTLLILIALLLSLAAEAWAKKAWAADVSTSARTCGTSPNDWCPSRRDDPCGRHKNTAACKADPKCFGMPYRGESLVACFLDERGFASNCPTVGCTSKPPKRQPAR